MKTLALFCLAVAAVVYLASPFYGSAVRLCDDIHSIAESLQSLTQPASPVQPAIYPDAAPYQREFNGTF